VSDACRASSLPVMLSAFCQRIAPSPNTSDYGVTYYEQVSIAAS
jgi:hypothetical protein